MERHLSWPVVLGALVALAGCSSSDTPGPGTPDAVTWYRDVLPIVQTRCQECHTDGGIAPFSLRSYAEAKAMHTSLASAVSTRRMPPWMPDDSCVSYVGERRLSQAEIDTLVAWSEAGAPEGDPADAPPPPPVTGTLPRVDATLDTGVDYTPTSTPTDDYRCFMVDPGLTQDRDLTGYDIVPGSRSEVHHVLLYVDSKASAEARDAAQAGPGWTCFGGPGTSSPRMLGAWVPGSGATLFPAGTGIRLKAGEVVVAQIHYNTSQRVPQPDRTVMKLQYSPQPVSTVAAFVAVAQLQFSIPPRSTGFTAFRDFDATSGLKVYGVLPHMHTLGQSIRVENVSKSQCFVQIPRWDFHWQQVYFFQQPLQVTVPDTIRVSCTWDNYTDRTIHWGESTEDEMCINYFYVTGL